jgi:hypothetical protein
MYTTAVEVVMQYASVITTIAPEHIYQLRIDQRLRVPHLAMLLPCCTAV